MISVIILSLSVILFILVFARAVRILPHKWNNLNLIDKVTIVLFLGGCVFSVYVIATGFTYLIDTFIA